MITRSRWVETLITDPLGVGLDFVVREDSGHYVTVVRIVRRLIITDLGIGECVLTPGYYANVGTMKRNLCSRVARHLTPKKPNKHWHIDWVTTAHQATVLGVVLVPYHDWTEHSLSDAIGARFKGTNPIPGFSSADCLAGCRSHLWRLPRPVTLLQVARAVSGVCAVRAP